jgi:outer membrane protein assembly factor BamB
LLLGDYVYGAKAGGVFLCLKAATGEGIWKTSTVTDSINSEKMVEDR